MSGNSNIASYIDIYQIGLFAPDRRVSLPVAGAKTKVYM